MPYFFIVPAYLFLLLVLGSAVFVTRLNEKSRPASRYLFAGLIGTIPGIIAANVWVTLAGILPIWISEQVSPPDWLRQVLSGIALVCLFLGPFAASAFGVMSGFIAGTLWARGHRKRSG